VFPGSSVVPARSHARASGRGAISINNMYYIYILKSKKDLKLYIGFTKNLKNRFKEHSKGKVKSTKNRRPFILVYYEAFLSKEDAIEKEKYYKSGPGRKYIKRHIRRTLNINN